MDKDGPETMREAVARAIDPHPFRHWDEMANYCLLQGDDDEDARRFADATHGPKIEAALKKADAAIRTVLERLREVSEAMIEAGMKCAHIDLASEYRAMLDAAAREVG